VENSQRFKTVLNRKVAAADDGEREDKRVDDDDEVSLMVLSCD
jgi:hypothetical protein